MFNAIVSSFAFLLAASTITSSPNPQPLELQPREAGYVINRMTISFYGWPDNNNVSCSTGCSTSPSPGNTVISGKCGRSDAGGSGTYNDPITAATHSNNKILGQCEKFYLPYLNRWFINEDNCPDCVNENPHIDIWVGGIGISDCPEICNCENSLTPTATSARGWGQT